MARHKWFGVRPHLKYATSLKRDGTGDISRGSLTPEQVAEYTDALTRHFAEPVAPVSRYCRAIDDYIKCLIDEQSDGPYSPEVGAAIREHGPTISTFAMKSALLGRLIYLGQRPRTVKCPVHKGRWSGCASGYLDCGCGDSEDGRWGNITGWLPK